MLFLQAQWVDLTTEELKHRPGKLELPLPDIGQNISFDVYIFTRARACNQRVFWPYKSIYEKARFDQYRGQSSKWFFAFSNEWRELFVREIGADQIVHGCHHSFASTQKLDLEEKQRCLPQACVTTFGLLLNWAGGISCSQRLEVFGSDRQGSVVVKY